MTGPLPYDLAAEEALIGRMLVRPSSTGDIAQVITAADFHQPLHGDIYAALVDAWRNGQALDPVELQVAMHGAVDSPTLSRMMSSAPGSHDRLVRELVGLRVRRDVITAAAEAQQQARDMSLDALDVLDHATSLMTAVDAPAGTVRDLWRMDDFLDQDTETDPWVIPGMFRLGWRAVVVAVEGRGKSWLSRQIAMAAAAGVHPLFGSPIPPVRSLIVDLENPAGSIIEAGRAIRNAARTHGSWDPESCHIWHRPDGIDLRRRADRTQLEAVIREARPDFVALGPLYKAYTTRAAEGHELPAGEVQSVLDDLRTRHGFALLIEHHAPKAQGGVRDILPYGSSLWLRWPELGLKLTPVEPGSSTLTVGRWRADRMRNAWPDRIAYGQTWPWVGEWDRPYREVMEAVA